MADPVWGLLPKAQDDAETIEEAIARLITAHEADANAHTGQGESLETHKTQDIIDHPARSVYDDKFAFDRNVVDIIFDSLSPFSITPGVELNGINGLYFNSPDASTSRQLYGGQSDMTTSAVFYYQLAPRMLTSFMVTQITSQLGYLIVGERDEGRGFGFKILDNKLYGIYYKADFSEDTLELLTLVVGTVYKVEAVVTYPARIDFYVNNVLIASMTTASLVTTMDFVLNTPWIDWKATTASARELYIKGFHWEADIPS